MNEKMLYTIEDIAALHDCSIPRARTLVRLPDFPREAKTSTPRCRRWIGAEVLAYIKRSEATDELITN